MLPDDNVFGCSGGTGGADELGFAEALPGDAPTFNEYLAEHVVETDEGWIVEGDIEVFDFALVEQAYRHAVGIRTNHQPGLRATVACDPFYAVDSVLNPAQKLMLSYCFTKSWEGHPELEALARQGLRNAATQWEVASDVNFVEVDIDPGECRASREDIDFEVRYVAPCTPTTAICYRALATFPYSTKYRSLSFRATAFESPVEAERIVAHELGHFLGLWHEHQRWPQGSGTCSQTISDDSTEWRGVTRADPDSVMGYPNCAGTEPQPPHPSVLDLVTVEYLYGLPRTEALASSRLIWHHPTSAQWTVWQRSSAPGSALQFQSITDCWRENCDTSTARFWRPFVLDLDADPFPDVFMYGPGIIDDRIYTNVGDPNQASSIEAFTLENAAVPWVLDEFHDGGTTTLWWQRPGLEQDALWQFTGSDDITQSLVNQLPTHGEFFLASVGHFASTTGLQLYWWSPSSSESYAVRWTGGSLAYDTIYPAACGLVADTYYNRFPGNFDQDAEDELIWYEPRTGVALLWRSLLGCYQPGQLSIVDWGLGKPLVGRFDDDNVDDVLVYRPDQSLVSYFDGGTVAKWTRPFSGDTSPFVADLNGDGCDDLLWYAPEQASSRFWRSNCAGDFVEEAALATPRGYPLGYGSGHGRLPLRSY